MNRSEFKALEAKWYAKLKATGFVDIETTSAVRDNMRNYRMLNTAGVCRDATIHYYQEAFQALERQKFKTPVLRRVWRLHCQGMYSKDIADKTGLSRQQVTRAIRNLRVRFKLVCTR